DVRDLGLYFLDDGQGIIPPTQYAIELWHDGKWIAPDVEDRNPEQPTGHRSNRVRAVLRSRKIRITLTHRAGGRSGLTEIETWGPVEGEFNPAPMPKGNLARGAKTSASF